MVLKTTVIKSFLEQSTRSDLARLYNHDMEVQVNVAQDGGERTDGEFKGKHWHGWTDGVTTWKSFRIPYNAATNPEYVDKDITFDLANHAEGIGMTGWDWKNKVSRWVAFDFDSIIGHSDISGLTNEELAAVERAACNIEWVTIRRSTSGKGLHLYVFLDNVPTETHTEHAALARSILGLMSAITGHDFQLKVDSCGGNMWVWHRKMKDTQGLELVRQGTVLYDAPPNWKDHVKVINGSRKKNLPQQIEESGKIDLFDEITGQIARTPLDEEHKKLIDYLRESGKFWYWDQDHHLLVTHTVHLKSAFEELCLKGFYNTSSPATNLNEQNCFASPLRKGAWIVRRFTPGVKEDDTWFQSQSGWTTCYFNKEPDLQTVSRAYGGVEDPKGGYVFTEAEMASKAALLLGVDLGIGDALHGRETRVAQHKDGRMIVEVIADKRDRGDQMPGWLPKKDKWMRIFNINLTVATEPDTGNYDDIIRHLVSETNEDYGWIIKSDSVWREEPLTHVKVALGSLGFSAKDQTNILGASIFKCWKLVNRPFQPEYPGNREWNRSAAQFRFVPTTNKDTLIYPSWNKILQHIGSGLDEGVKNNPWCKANGILNGADYLKCWVASLFQEPDQPLPYLFFYGPQNCGKSIFHEALNILLTKGCISANSALISSSGFNGELEGGILCTVEEMDLNKNKQAYNRIKEWVTGRHILIHPKGRTPYNTINTTHWVQVSNDFSSCPIFPGDTRIVMVSIPKIEPVDMIPKKIMVQLLEKEASDFLAEVLSIELPVSTDRLNVPVVETEEKSVVQLTNMTQLDLFLKQYIVEREGCIVKFSDFYTRFLEWCDPNEVSLWSKKRVAVMIPPSIPKGIFGRDQQIHLGNIYWAHEEPTIKYPGHFVNKGGVLITNHDNK